MIKPEEIRRGIYIKDRGGKIWQIECWETPNKVASKSPLLYVDPVFGEMLGHPLTEEVKFIEGIEINTNILLKGGFTKSEYEEYKIQTDNGIISRNYPF